MLILNGKMLDIKRIIGGILMNRKIVAFMLILAIVLGVVNTPQIIAEAKTTSKVKSIKIINPKKLHSNLKSEANSN